MPLAPPPLPLPRFAAFLVATDIASGLIARPGVSRGPTSPLLFPADAVPAAVGRGGVPDLRTAAAAALAVEGPFVPLVPAVSALDFATAARRAALFSAIDRARGDSRYSAPRLDPRLCPDTRRGGVPERACPDDEVGTFVPALAPDGVSTEAGGATPPDLSFPLVCLSADLLEATTDAQAPAVRSDSAVLSPHCRSGVHSSTPSVHNLASTGMLPSMIAAQRAES